MNDNEIEQKLADAPAPRVTKADLLANIKHVAYVRNVTAGGQVLRWCVITTQSGFAVTGRPSAAVSPENDNAEVGESVAYRDAENQLWMLMGYTLKDQLHREQLERSAQALSTSAEHFQKLDRIARVCHEVNRAYCTALGDHSQPQWEDAPPWQRESARMGVDLHLSGDFGPEASHVSWMKQKDREGWVYGPVKDANALTHPCMVPFAQLPREQQAKDYIFRAVVHALK